MGHTLRVNGLSSAAIKDAIEDVQFLMDQLNTAAAQTSWRLADIGTEYARDLCNSAPYGSELTVTAIGPKGANNLASIKMSGEEAVYSEFGTGEVGADDGHPLKGNFGLNPYNSGPVVSKHINRETHRHYWYVPNGAVYEPEYVTEKTSKSGNTLLYTEGVPSGKQMYNTSKYIRRIAHKVVTEELSDALSYLK